LSATTIWADAQDAVGFVPQSRELIDGTRRRHLFELRHGAGHTGPLQERSRIMVKTPDGCTAAPACGAV
jgi:hypothetical protein